MALVLAVIAADFVAFLLSGGTCWQLLAKLFYFLLCLAGSIVAALTGKSRLSRGHWYC